MKLDSRFLRSHPLLSLLPTIALRRLVSDAALREYPKGSVVFRQNEPCDALYLIISGRCESRRTGDNNHLISEVFGPGDTLGDRELLNDEPYRSTVTVVTRSVLLRIPGEELRELFLAKPKVAGRFSRAVIERFRHTDLPRFARRLVALHSLSPQIHERALAQRLAGALHSITHQRVLLVHIGPEPAKVSLSDWALIEPTVNGKFCFADELREAKEGYSELDLRCCTDENERGYIAPMLSHFGAHFHYVILQIGSDTLPLSLIECLVQSDLTYLFLRPDSASLYSYRLLIRHIDTQTHGDSMHFNPVLCTEDGDVEDSRSMSQALLEMGHPVHSYLRGYPLSGSTGLIDRSQSYHLYINRLAREIARCRIGLALSSGGARGLAHIGVIQVLEENGIEVDAVAGSSMGAYVAAVWASGHDGTDCEKIAREIESRWGLLHLLDPVMPPRRGFVRTSRVVKRLRRSIGRAHFSEMLRPLRVVSTYLDTLERVVFSTGEVAEAVEASIAIPGICVPVVIDGETYIDGGIADPLPVDVLHEMGIEHVIAVNTIPTPERLRHCVDVEKELSAHPHHRKTFGGLLGEHLNYFARGNLFDILFRAIHGTQTRVADASAREADIALRPWACDARWHDFTHPGKYIALGRKVTEDQLPEIKALAHPLHLSLHDSEPAALAITG